MPTPKADGKTGRCSRRQESSAAAAAPDAPLPAGILGIGTQRPSRRRDRGTQSGSDVFPKFSATCCASPAAAASGPWKSRPPMQSDCTAATRSGRTSRSGCSTTPASSAPAGMKKTGAGRRSRRRSPLRIADPISCAWMSGWPRSITLRPCRAATARLWRKSSARRARWPTSWPPNRRRCGPRARR